MNYYNDIRELVGNTPLLKLNNIYPRKGVNIFAKLELFNPGGSVKDRIGLSMIEKAEAEGLLKPGGAIVEATAGNTGLGVALAALNKGYRVVLAVPEKFSVEKQILMKALGAELVITPRSEGMKGAMAQAEQLLKTIPDAISLKQFENPANPEVHYRTTGPEIYEALHGDITHLVAGAGSGGTFSGIARYLKEMNPTIQTIVAEPIGSTMGGGEEGCYEIEGIGNNFIPETMDMSLADGFIAISDAEAFEAVKRLAVLEGVIGGSSSGAALAAAIRLADTLEKGNVVVVLPDRGDRYFSKGILGDIQTKEAP